MGKIPRRLFCKIDRLTFAELLRISFSFVFSAFLGTKNSLKTTSSSRIFCGHKAHKLKKILRTPAGCPWDTRRDKQGSTGRCPRDFLLFAIEKLTFLPGHRPGVPGTPRRPGGFQKIYVIFSYVPFLLPKNLGKTSIWARMSMTRTRGRP